MGRQQFTKDQTRVAVGVFYEILYGFVPEHRLNDCYIFVKRNRSNTFELKPEEIAAAWIQIRESERYSNNPAKQLTHGFCNKCNNTGTEVKRDEQYRVTSARPCSH